jgi:hypothetical protein
MSDMLDDLSDMFPHTILHRSVTVDGMGTPSSYGTSTSWKARVRGHTRLVRDFAGRETVSTVKVTIKGKPGVKQFDEITLPTGWAPQKPPLINVSWEPDEGGLHHEVLFF